MGFMWPLVWAQGDPQNHKKHLRLNKIATLAAINFLSEGDTSNLRPDSEDVAKSKLEYKLSTLYLLPPTNYDLSKSE